MGVAEYKAGGGIRDWSCSTQEHIAVGNGTMMSHHGYFSGRVLLSP